MDWLWGALAAAALTTIGYFIKSRTSWLEIKPDWTIEKRSTGIRITRTRRATAFSVQVIAWKNGDWVVEPRPARSAIDGGESDIKNGESFDLPTTDADSVQITWIDGKRLMSHTELRDMLTNSEKATEVTPSYI